MQTPGRCSSPAAAGWLGAIFRRAAVRGRRLRGPRAGDTPPAASLSAGLRRGSLGPPGSQPAAATAHLPPAPSASSSICLQLHLPSGRARPAARRLQPRSAGLLRQLAPHHHHPLGAFNDDAQQGRRGSALGARDLDLLTHRSQNFSPGAETSAPRPARARPHQPATHTPHTPHTRTPQRNGHLRRRLQQGLHRPSRLRAQGHRCAAPPCCLTTRAAH
jgi:hypothetical protein